MITRRLPRQMKSCSLLGTTTVTLTHGYYSFLKQIVCLCHAQMRDSVDRRSLFRNARNFGLPMASSLRPIGGPKPFFHEVPARLVPIHRLFTGRPYSRLISTYSIKS